MKKVVLFPILFIALSSCEVQADLTKDKVTAIPVSQVSVLKYQGVFMPTSGIEIAGGVKIYLDANQNKLELDKFSISSGPDLKVYLSKSNTPAEIVNLGNLNPANVYVIPQSVDVSVYKYVLIHCQQYSHLFAFAELIKK
jgi:hypothetical protein